MIAAMMLLAAVRPGLCQEAEQAEQATAGDLRIELVDGVARAWRGDQVAFEYHFRDDLPKPFVHPLLTPEGHAVTRLSPVDHIHHRALMFALGNVSFADEAAPYTVFWGERGSYPDDRLGRIIQRSAEVESGDGTVSVTGHLEWRRDGDDALMLTEDRRITLLEPPAPRCTALTWQTDLTAPDRDVILGPTEGREVSYYGLGIRTPQDMDGGRIVDANGKEGEQAVLGDDATWCAYIGPNEPVRGFAMFDHPSNPRHPTGWFVMSAGFGYMTASIVCHEPYELDAGEKLNLRYGVCAFDGDATEEDVDRWYQAWLAAEG